MLSYKYRTYIWYILLLLAFILILVQLFTLQVLKSAGIVHEAKKQFYKQAVLLRGDIRDRNGNVLVLDVITYELYNNARNVNNISKEKINELAKLLSISSDSLLGKLSREVDSKILSGINESTASKIRRSNIDFVYLRPKLRRIYPHQKMAAHIIGFVNHDHNGQHGVEYYYEKLLTRPSARNSASQPFSKGTDIVLTIDSVLQEYCEEELNQAVSKSRASRGTIIVLSPKTGEVYAWAVYPNYDPNVFYKEKPIKNWSITDIYEPGSTFKIITVASALENMTIDLESTFYDPGSIKVGTRTIRNHHKTEPRYINLLELFKRSSNVACAQVGLSMNPETFYTSIKRFRIGRKTSIDLPGESEGLLLSYKEWRKLELATTAFGQGAVSVTPLQLASAISAIASGGIWNQPHVLKGIWEPKYKLVTTPPYQTLSEQVISSGVASSVSSLLRQSVKENLKAMLYVGGNVPGYEVAGKTGTAQKIREGSKGYLSGHTVASFVGYLPANDPQILVLVVVDDPKTEGGWGNTVCGPVFNNVAKLAAKRVIEDI